MKNITFYYVPDITRDLTSGKEATILRPKIPVRFLMGNRQLSPIFECLLDTGADKILLPAAWGEALGLKIKKGKLVKTGGVGGIIDAYRHEITIFLGTHKIKTEGDFTYGFNIPLLGRLGFMDKFEKIEVNEKKKYITMYYE